MSIHEDIARVVVVEDIRQQFIPTRYPHTYAYDLVREFPAVVDASSGHYSRADASGLVRTYAEATGQDREEVKRALADAYLARWNVQDVPADLAEVPA